MSTVTNTEKPSTAIAPLTAVGTAFCSGQSHLRHSGTADSIEAAAVTTVAITKMLKMPGTLRGHRAPTPRMRNAPPMRISGGERLPVDGRRLDLQRHVGAALSMRAIVAATMAASARAEQEGRATGPKKMDAAGVEARSRGRKVFEHHREAQLVEDGELDPVARSSGGTRRSAPQRGSRPGRPPRRVRTKRRGFLELRGALRRASVRAASGCRRTSHRRRRPTPRGRRRTGSCRGRPRPAGRSG